MIQRVEERKFPDTMPISEIIIRSKLILKELSGKLSKKGYTIECGDLGYLIRKKVRGKYERVDCYKTLLGAKDFVEQNYNEL